MVIVILLLMFVFSSFVSSQIHYEERIRKINLLNAEAKEDIYKRHLPRHKRFLDKFRELREEEDSMDEFENRFSKHRRFNERMNLHSESINQGVNINTASSVTEEWVRHYASGLALTFDVAVDIAVDTVGNVYVTGYSSKSPFGLDYYTAKYDSSGNLLWAVRYDGTIDDIASAIAIDAAGNVYVTGYSVGWDSDYDYATIKYNSLGEQQWVARYNGPRNYYDIARAIVVDEAGNVYVTGGSVGWSSDFDYATIKYNSEGIEQWVARYNGPRNSDDNATAIAIDASGNVYVTGESEGILTYYDYATIKYNSEGVEQWVARYDGPLNKRDSPTAIVVDISGNVYVTGWSAGTGTSFDYATIKYNSEGVEQWVARYDGGRNLRDIAKAISIDAMGNVYVTGESRGRNTFYDYATIKYNSEGVEQWVARYNGPANSNDYPNAMVIDSSGNVYVTGLSGAANDDYATIKYNSEGIQQWVAIYNGPGNSDDVARAIAIDASGNVYVTGYSYGLETHQDFATIKYNNSGEEQWINRYNSPENSYDVAYAQAVDASGNVYVTGISNSSSTNFDFATIKYNSEGIQQWVARYNGPENSDDGAFAIAIDPAGNVYVTGTSYSFITDFDYVTIKYNSEGIEQWVARYNGPGHYEDYAYAIALDAAGNVYVTGESYGLGTNYDYATVKYNKDGVEQWVSRYNGTGNSFDGAIAIAVDLYRNVYVSGSSYGLETYSDYATIKYNSEGVEQWVARYNGPDNLSDEVSAMVIDAYGNVYVTGRSDVITTDYNFDCLTIKYNREGVEEWVARYNGTANEEDWANAIAVDELGNVYITGSSIRVGTGFDYITIKYNKEGEEQWISSYNGPRDSTDGAFAITLDASRNVYVTGISRGVRSYYDYATIKYNRNGIEQWVSRYDGPGNYDDIPYAIALDASRNVYVTGCSNGMTWCVYTTIKYTQDATTTLSINTNDRWNIISVPLTLNDYRRSTLFPTAISPAYTYTNSYVSKDTLKNGVGYWLKFPSAQTVPMTGFQVYSTTIDVVEGWNMIGSISNTIPVSDITSIPGGIITSNFYGYDRGYKITDSIYPGRGYWVKVNQAGKLILLSSDIISIANKIRIVPTKELPPPPPAEGTEVKEHLLPIEFALEQNHPNPFNPVTVISYHLPAGPAGLPVESRVTLRIYNTLGQEVKTLVDEVQVSGYKAVEWDATNNAGNLVTSGVYFYRIDAVNVSDPSKTFTQVRKMLVLK